MLALALQLLALALYAAFAPMATLVCVLLLEPPAPVRRAGAFVAGYAGALILIGAAGSTFFARWMGPLLTDLLVWLNHSRGESAAGRDVLTLLIGLVLLGLGLWRWWHRSAGRGALPGWLRAAEGLGPVRAAGLGALMLVTNLDNVIVYLAAVNLVAGAGLEAGWRLTIYLLLALTGCAFVAAPLVIYVLFPSASSGLLAVFEAWIRRLSQAVVALLLVALGGWLFLRGLGALAF